MRKKTLILITIVLLIAILSTLVLYSCTNKSGPSASDDYQKEVEQKQKDREDDDYEYEEEEVVDPTQLNEGVYPSTLPSLFYDIETEEIQAGLQQSATTLQVREAVLVAYNVANRSRKQAENSLMIQHTDSGMMIFNGFELKSGNAWYYQLPREAAFDGLSNTQVAYTLDRETFYYAKLDSSSGAKCHDIDTFPYGEFILTEAPKAYDFDGYREHRFFLDDQLELCNMKLMLDLIDETSSISYDSETHVYTIVLNIDCDGGDTNLLKEWAAQAQAEANSEMEVERTYEKWDSVIEVWDNGYVKSFEYDEYWKGTIDAGFTKAELDGPATSYFKFFYEEDEIMTLLEQDTRYNALSDEDKELMTTPLSFIEMYCGAEISRGNLVSWQIALIAIASVVFVVIVVVVTIEVLVRVGKLPKLAAKREAAKQKHLAKKAAKKGESVEQVESPDEVPFEEFVAEESAQEEPQKVDEE